MAFLQYFIDFFKHNPQEFRAVTSDEVGRTGYLLVEPRGITFHADFAWKGNEHHTAAQTIRSIEVHDTSSQTSRHTFTRLFFLRWFALAFPKKSTHTSSQLDIWLHNGGFVSYVLPDITRTDFLRRAAGQIDTYFQDST